MHAVDGFVVLAPLAQLERAREIDADRLREPLQLVRAELGRGLERREARAQQDLVRVCPANASDGALVAHQRVELPALALEDRGERRRVELEHIAAEVGEIGLERLTRHEPDTGALLLASLGEHKLAPPSKRKRNIGALGFLAPAVRKRSRPALIRWIRRTRSSPSTGKRRFLPRRSAPSSRLPSSVDSGGSNVFSVAMCAGPACSIGARRHERVELAHPRLDLRQLRHRAARRRRRARALGWRLPCARSSVPARSSTGRQASSDADRADPERLAQPDLATRARRRRASRAGSRPRR